MGEDASIQVCLDGKPLLNWSGKQTAVSVGRLARDAIRLGNSRGGDFSQRPPSADFWQGDPDRRTRQVMIIAVNLRGDCHPCRFAAPAESILLRNARLCVSKLRLNVVRFDGQSATGPATRKQFAFSPRTLIRRIRALLTTTILPGFEFLLPVVQLLGQLVRLIASSRGPVAAPLSAFP